MTQQSPPSPQALQGLADYRAAVSAAKRRDIDKAIRHLRRTGATINVATVAARAGVQRKTVYKHPDAIAIIDQYRREPATNGPAATGFENSIIAALRQQLAVKDHEIKTLRKQLAEHQTTIELLYGQLDR
ncbi:transposase [Mycobacteroides abscessus]|uniref:transposase n=1 Tax=Mycobacteroides abscessus TaxID=36809 RepID=UPI000C25E49C|nr:transposase [Mycobacteroides abscessus]